MPLFTNIAGELSALVGQACQKVALLCAGLTHCLPEL